MKITIEATEWLKRYIPESRSVTLEVTDGLSVLESLKLAGVPEDEIGFALVNGVRQDLMAPLKEGDSIKPYPAIIGG
ncbi:MAG: hypothetical protein N2376_10470 [Clostridia bacterium]|nr:hypothetical protein [Clostridia bacterium]